MSDADRLPDFAINMLIGGASQASRHAPFKRKRLVVAHMPMQRVQLSKGERRHHSLDGSYGFEVTARVDHLPPRKLLMPPRKLTTQ